MGRVTAFDIETVPLANMQDWQLQRLEQAVERLSEQYPDKDRDSLRIMGASLDPMLGRVVCISFATEPGETWSILARQEMDEARALRSFWETVSLYNHTWVSFNGKAFDIPFLIARSMFHSIEITPTPLLNLNPYTNIHHIDLNVALRVKGGLEAFCNFLGISNPKLALGGAEVANAAILGQFDQIAHYCEQDALATLFLYQRAKQFIWDGPAYPKRRR